MPKRGNKQCKNCGGVSGVRAFVCKHCDSPFKMRKMQKGPKSRVVDDWRNLQQGDRVKVVGGNGTYYIDDTGEKQYLVDRGVYIVSNVLNNGIQVYREHGGGYSFLYMGESQPSPLCEGLYRAPHKLTRLRNS